MSEQKRILLVDDDEGVLFVLRHALTTLGREYQIVTARQGQTALSKIREAPFDIVVTDLRMPDMDGVELTEAIRGLDPSAVVIWITAYDCYRRSGEAARLRVYRCLDKPLEIHEIRETVSEALCQRPSEPVADINAAKESREAPISGSVTR